ncbi:hypothetical protein DL766_004707 [Monosporascus sp. MC13-8B]|uniref:CCHC-type domain-containing protein n=1 Tax=Monosporascus cannonballus TaxID=155416 RepID=A0ABY0H9W6_9PEZI|nr:hypothetical protein DL762_004739 [Monosporascus cannonballus]RYP01305.1 hypothetical protein DL763_000277 [Monosporascus cannonballus]RYP30759.1 hypothetical protein DL766_004707 [Monosporascus sp. MC13-8B]
MIDWYLKPFDGADSDAISRREPRKMLLHQHANRLPSPINLDQTADQHPRRRTTPAHQAQPHLRQLTVRKKSETKNRRHQMIRRWIKSSQVNAAPGHQGGGPYSGQGSSNEYSRSEPNNNRGGDNRGNALGSDAPSSDQRYLTARGVQMYPPMKSRDILQISNGGCILCGEGHIQRYCPVVKYTSREKIFHWGTSASSYAWGPHFGRNNNDWAYTPLEVYRDCDQYQIPLCCLIMARAVHGQLGNKKWRKIIRY